MATTLEELREALRAAAIRTSDAPEFMQNGEDSIREPRIKDLIASLKQTYSVEIEAGMSQDSPAATFTSLRR